MTYEKKSGRGLRALQDASRWPDPYGKPRGLGVRAVLCRLLFQATLILTAAGMFSSVAATEPSSTYNVDGEVRSRTCTPLLLPTATLRFPDGTPTGFYAYGDDPSKNGSAP